MEQTQRKNTTIFLRREGTNINERWIKYEMDQIRWRDEQIRQRDGTNIKERWINYK